jgi:hypothetical protein
MVIVYKAIFGNYDHLPKHPSVSSDDFRHIILSDKKLKIEGWETLKVDRQGMTNTFANRFYKFFPWKVLPAQNTIYTDGHIEIKPSFYDYISNLEKFPRFACPIHRKNGDVFDEFLRNLDAEKLTTSEITNFKSSKIDLTKKAIECGLILRREPEGPTKAFSELWWSNFTDICARDQLLVNDAAIYSSFDIEILPFSLNQKDYFNIRAHKNIKYKLLIKRIKVAWRVLSKGKVLP